MKSSLLIVMVWFLGACSPADFVASQSKDEEKEAEASDEELADLPVNVTGSYLACAIRQEPSTSEPERVVGCRISDRSTNEKVELDAYKDNINWSVDPSELAKVEIVEHPAWHVFYRFQASDKLAADNLLAQANFSFELRGLESGEIVSFTSPASSTLRDITEFDDPDAPVLFNPDLVPETPGPL